MINLCIMIFTLISDNSKCGFYSIITTLIKYRFNYWLILFHFLISEQELILVLFLVFGLHSIVNGLIIVLLSIILFFDTFLF